jgi:hypothetical protein
MNFSLRRPRQDLVEFLNQGMLLLDGIAQHYTLPRIVITIVLDPSLPIAA